MGCYLRKAPFSVPRVSRKLRGRNTETPNCVRASTDGMNENCGGFSSLLKPLKLFKIYQNFSFPAEK